MLGNRSLQMCSVETMKMRIVHCTALIYRRYHHQPCPPAHQGLEVTMDLSPPFISYVLSGTVCYFF